jgi:hypothetical protein
MIPFGIAFWKGIEEYGIDPITLGQPLAYYQMFNTDSPYMNPANPINDTQISSLTRFNDGGLTATGLTNGIYRRYISPTKNPYGTLFFSAANSNQRMTFGTTATFAPLVTANFEFTIYWVVKPDVINASTGSGTRLIGLGGGASTGEVGISLWIFYDPNTLRYSTAFARHSMAGLGVQDGGIYSEFTDSPLRVISFRGLDPRNTTTDAVIGYLNGVQQNQRPLDNIPGTINNTATIGCLGGRANATGSLGRMNLGEIIVFPTHHDEETHSKVVKFLTDKWNIDVTERTDFQADENVTLDVDGKIQEIESTLGNTQLTQPTALNRLEYLSTGWNGKPCIQGTDNGWLRGGKHLIGKRGTGQSLIYTAYAMIEEVDNTGTQFIIHNSNTERRMGIIGVGSVYRIYASNDINASTSKYATFPRLNNGEKAFIIYTYDADGATNADKLKVWVNGVQQTLTFVGNVDAAIMINYMLCGGRGDGTNGFLGKTACFGMINRAITETEVLTLTNQMINKWGL